MGRGNVFNHIFHIFNGRNILPAEDFLDGILYNPFDLVDKVRIAGGAQQYLQDFFVPVVEGYGAITVVQSAIITFYVIYVLKVMMIGSLWLVMLVTLLSAMTALSLGILLSTAASSEFQMIQFIPIVIVPQVFFTGLFDLSPGWAAVGKIMPIYYVADALDKIMIRGSGFGPIALDVIILLGLTGAFMAANTLLLKRYRRI